MADDQINVPSLVLVLVLSGLVIRYLFFSPSGDQAGGAQQGSGGRSTRDASAAATAQRRRDEAAERIVQMFPQVDRRTALWDLQRNGCNITATTERILAGRMETPPITFQPPPPPGAATGSSSTSTQARPAADKPAQPDLIQRYKLQDKLAAEQASGAEPEAQPAPGQAAGKGKGWSNNKEERQSLLQKRRDEMILAARRKMEAKIAAEKAKTEGAASS
ncbi:uncharacterized protein E0L32_008543 [Thyridium curvatum]|uniref:CUE domain-containing protein n=1 Tax=Thyridium curvatum TaxID=1093900 RepID=A0A507ARQ6_9PEZI|nr:uncharacterized protein E0L32_008543 [Thyridium curvatum]TPX10493.1 hypothetical protein E0L32_008543 [Thyridium curvatum]